MGEAVTLQLDKDSYRLGDTVLITPIFHESISGPVILYGGSKNNLYQLTENLESSGYAWKMTYEVLVDQLVSSNVAEMRLVLYNADMSKRLDVKDFKVLYTPPTISYFEVYRDHYQYGVDIMIAQGRWDYTAGGSSPLEGSETPLTIQVDYRERGGYWSPAIPAYNVSGGVFYEIKTLPTLDKNKSYDFRLTITDVFGKTATSIVTIGTVKKALTIAEDKGIGVGKVWERGALDVEGDSYFNGSIYFNDIHVWGFITNTFTESDAEYIKFSEGTLICRGRKTVTGKVNIQWGSLYYMEGPTLQFPHPFVGKPNVSYQIIEGNAGIIIPAGNVSTTHTQRLDIYRPTPSDTERTFTISYIAIGDWKEKPLG